MQNPTRKLFDAYLANQAKLNGVSDATKQFSVAPAVEQILEKRIQEKADFLGKINIAPVRDQIGQKLGLGASSPIASRTNTSISDRQTRDPTGMDDRKYETAQTNFDTHVTYAKMDMWSSQPNFQSMIRDVITEQTARDRLMVGFNGTHAAAQTDLTTYPMLQDVNKGWLQEIREKAPARVMTGAKVGDHAGATYKTFDALVEDMINEMLDAWHAEATDLVVIVGRRLLNDKYLQFYNEETKPTEIQALKSLTLTKTLGSKVAITVPFFPPRGLLVTSLKNLSIYWQQGTRRRTIIDNARRDRVENFDSVNEAYVVEDLGKVAFAEAIKTPSNANGNTDGWL